MFRSCCGAKPGGSTWTSWVVSTVPAAGASCLKTSNKVSQIAFERAVLEAEVHENKWSPRGSIVLVFEQRHFCGQDCVGSFTNKGSRNFLLIAVWNTLFG